jgi:DNA repair photolyase
METTKEDTDYLKGRGAQLNPFNPYRAQEYVVQHIEGLDEKFLSNSRTQYFTETPKNIVNKVDSPDVGMAYSLNPYQGCEHGCIYCYARNSHQYWGFSAGLDFERKIIVKPNAPELLEKKLLDPKWEPYPILISGNTDCYQPVERKLKITRRLLEVMLKYKHPVGMITKNWVILRDIDILTELAKYNLVHVMVSITSLREELRLQLEPRTASVANRLKVVEKLNAAGIPTGVMTAPIIPGLNSDEIPAIIEEVGKRGGVCAGYTIVRLNGSIAEVFEDWIKKSFPDRADKVLNQIKECHGGTLNDSRFGTRMRGEGKIAESIRLLHKMAVKKYLKGRDTFEYNLEAFTRPGQMKMF